MEPIKDDSMICMECFCPVSHVARVTVEKPRGQHAVRAYLGYCKECNQAFEVVQFQPRGQSRWYLNQYREYELIDGQSRPGLWRTVQEILGDPRDDREERLGEQMYYLQEKIAEAHRKLRMMAHAMESNSGLGLYVDTHA